MIAEHECRPNQLGRIALLMQLREDIERFFEAAGAGDERRELLGLVERNVGPRIEEQLADFVDRQILSVYFHVVKHCRSLL